MTANASHEPILAQPGETPIETGVDELLLLYEAGQEINKSLQLDEVLKTILTIAGQVSGADLTRIYLADRHENLSRSETLAKPAPLVDRPAENDLLFTLAQQAALSREPLCRRQTTAPAWPPQALKAALVIPLLTRDKLMAVLTLGSRAESAFPDQQVRWQSVFCDRAAIALENATLFRDLSSAYIDLAQSREAILQSRNTLQVLLDGITDDLYLVDPQLKISTFNRAGADQPAPEPSPAWIEAAPELAARLNESLQTGRETTWIPPEKETAPYLKDREFRIYPIRNRLGQVEQVLMFAQDVSERKRWQASLFRSANLAAVGRLAGSMAHQINNPLTVAMANSQLVLLEADPQSEIYMLTTAIFKATERIQAIVKNLLDFSNQETYFFVETDLVTTIEDALALIIHALKKAKVEVTKDYETQPRLSASVSHLKLVWMNLLLNACEAAADYAEHPQVTIATQMVSPREVKVSITDNGRGITPEAFEQLFRPFFTTKPVGKALGLGLYSAHTIVERHHGQIKVVCQHRATTFEVILPLDNPRDL